MIQDTPKNEIKFGAKKAKIRDPRQFKYHKTFGAFPISQVPRTFDFGTVPAIKNQGVTYWCTAFSGAYEVGHQMQVDSSPEYIAQKTIAYSGANPSNFNGTTPQIADKVLVKSGTIAQTASPFSFDKDDPTQIATPSNWPNSIDSLAQKPLGASFEVTTYGYGNLFDAVRAILFEKKMPLRWGMFWQDSWTSAPGGIITKDMVANLTYDNGHSMQIDPAVVEKNGEIYLRIPNSWGTQYGDNGYYYFSREAFNGVSFYISAYYPTADPEVIKKEQWGIMTLMLDKLVTALRLMQSLLQKAGL